LTCAPFSGRTAGATDARGGRIMIFRDRTDAGRQLARRLMRYAGRPDVLVLALPRGGVPVAAEVAHALGAPLDVVLVRKLGVPGHDELAVGAIASGGVRVLNHDVAAAHGIGADQLEAIGRRAMREVEAGEAAYRDGVPAVSPRGRTVLLVDDGLATGATVRAAICTLLARGPRAVVVAAPVAPADVCAALRAEADDVVCAATPDPFGAVGAWYRDFSPVTTDEVRRLLRDGRWPGAQEEMTNMAHTVSEVMTEKPVALQAGTTLSDAARAM